MRQWKINPNESAIWNVWDACKVAALFLRKQAMKKVKLSYDEWAELYDIIMLKAVTHFLEYKIRRKTYCHEVSFFTNCFSSVWGVFQRELDMYMNNVVKSKINSMDRMELTREAREWVMNTPLPRYKDKHTINANVRRQMRLWKERSMNPSYLRAEDEDDFMSYLECCEEFGIEPDKNAPLYKRGRWLVSDTM